MNINGLFERRSVLKAGALLGGLSSLLSRAALADAQEKHGGARDAVVDEVRMADIPLGSAAKVTVERLGQIVLIGIQSALHPQPCRSRNLRWPCHGVLPI
jgi:hypothetical protein